MEGWDLDLRRRQDRMVVHEEHNDSRKTANWFQSAATTERKCSFWSEEAGLGQPQKQEANW